MGLDMLGKKSDEDDGDQFTNGMAKRGIE